MLLVSEMCPATLGALGGMHDVNIMEQNAILVRLERARPFAYGRLGELKLEFRLNFRLSLVGGGAAAGIAKVYMCTARSPRDGTRA